MLQADVFLKHRREWITNRKTVRIWIFKMKD